MVRIDGRRVTIFMLFVFKLTISNGYPRLERMRKLLFVILVILVSLSADAQEPLDSLSLSLQRTYRSYGEAVIYPDSVYILDLSRQKRKVVPDEIRRFRNLQVLKLSRNNLKELPEWIGEFPMLEHLDLSNNSLGALPPSIGNLQHLKFLGLNRNVITTLPPEAGRLKRLEVLELWDNEVDSLPDDIRLLNSLRTLELRGILFSEQEQAHIRSLLPETDVLFSPSCLCKD